MEEQWEAHRVLIADSDPNVRQALWLVCEEALDFTVVGEAADAAEVQMLVRTTHPHMLLLEWSLPGANPTTLIPQLKQLARLTIIVVSSDPFVLSEAEKAGADGVISKADSPDKLLILLRSLIGKSE